MEASLSYGWSPTLFFFIPYALVALVNALNVQVFHLIVIQNDVN